MRAGVRFAPPPRRFHAWAETKYAAPERSSRGGDRISLGERGRGRHRGRRGAHRLPRAAFGFPELAGKLRALSSNGIRYRISTDYHGDHTIGAAFIEDESIISIAPQRVFDALAAKDNPLAGRETFVDTLNEVGAHDEAREIAEAVLPLPQVCFDEGMTLHLHPLTFEIYRLGGHTPACSSVYVPEEGVIFTGDVMINEPGPGMREARFREWIEALAWMESLPAAHVVPGHGEICGIEEVRRFRNGFEEMWEMMEGLVDKGTTQEEASTDESFEKFFWSDTGRGESWIAHRRRTFRRGLENLYAEVKEG